VVVRAHSARECESSITIEYLRALYAAYEKFITDIARVIPVIRVDYSKFRTVEVRAARCPLRARGSAAMATHGTVVAVGAGDGGLHQGGVRPHPQRARRDV
jgi:hypothetical protein